MLDTLNEDLSVFAIISSGKCSATINRTHSCVSMANAFTVYYFVYSNVYTSTVQRVALSRLHSNSGYANAPRYYVIRTSVM
jgi:hypothetical protein